MEDKELQELFEAKRTTEANRRRQEELAAMIAGKSKRSRPLWPMWVGAAAASVAVLIFALPALFRTESAAPIEVAHTEIPEVILPQETTAEEASPVYAKPIVHKAKNSTVISTVQENAEPQVIEAELPMPVVEKTTQEEKEETPAAPVRRVMRRTSTLIACTEGCTVPEGTSVRTDRNIEVTFFANNSNTDNLIYSFEINR